MALVLPQSRSILSPHQVGVGSSNGAESVIHSMKLLLSDPVLPTPTKHCLLIDFANAFNRIDRRALFKEVKAHIPSLFPWVELSYGVKSNLLFGNATISSCCGVQQGDPLGPLLFSLLLHPIVKKISHNVPGLRLNAWYLDDGVLCGSLEDLSSALSIIEDSGPSVGLSLNRSKSFLYLSDSSGSLPSSLEGIPSSSEGFVLLGAPIGSTSFCRSVVAERVEKIKSLISLLPSLEDSQSEFAPCVSLPKFLIALRTSAPEVLLPVCQQFDSVIFDALSNLIGGSVTSWARLKASLPIRLGGLGLRQAGVHCAAIFISSVHACSPLIYALSGQSVPSSYISSALQVFCSGLGWAPLFFWRILRSQFLKSLSLAW